MKKILTILIPFIWCSCGTTELPRIKPPATEVEMQDGMESMIERNKIDRTLRHLAADPKQIFAKNPKGQTPLHLASLRNREEIVEALLNAGAAVNAQDNNGDTPLHLAAYSKNEESIELLINAGADVNIKNKKGETSVHKAAVFCGDDVFQMILPKADFEAEDLKMNRPLHIAAKYQNFSFVHNLLKAKVKEDILNDEGDDPLMAGLKGLNSNEMMETMLISRVKSGQFRNKAQETYIHAAATNGKAHAIKLLLEKGAGVNTKDVNGVTPIVRALRHRKRDAAETLIRSGADLRAVDKDGRTLLHMMAFWLNEKTMLDRFLRVIDINTVDGKGRTALHEVAYWGHIKNANDMIANGAQVNIQAKNGETPLFDAVKSKNYAMAELLIKKGTKVNLKNAYGDTVLKTAIQSENKDLKIITLLLETGADQNIKNLYGETILHEAVRIGNVDIIRRLMDYKPDLTAKDKFGKTPIDWAKERKLTEVEKILNR